MEDYFPLNYIAMIPGSWILFGAVRWVGGLVSAVAGVPVAPQAISANRANRVGAVLHARFGNHQAPLFLPGSYTDAMRVATQQDKPLFIYLHSEDHHDSATFCRGTLFSHSFSDFLRVNCVSWAGDVKQADAYRLARTLGVGGFPFVAVVGRAARNTSQHTVILRHSGMVGPDQLLALMLVRIEADSSTRDLEEARRVNDSLDRQLRTEQDREYQEALAHDRAKAQERAAREEEAAKELLRQQDAAARASAEETECRRRLEGRASLRRAKKEALAAEPEAGQAEVVLIRVRLPASAGGKRLQRRFHAAARLQEVCDYVESLDLEFGADGTEAVVDGFEEGEYVLVTTMPRRVWTDGDTAIRELGRGKQLMLLVEEKVEEDDESEEDDEGDEEGRLA